MVPDRSHFLRLRIVLGRTIPVPTVEWSDFVCCLTALTLLDIVLLKPVRDATQVRGVTLISGGYH